MAIRLNETPRRRVTIRVHAVRVHTSLYTVTIIITCVHERSSLKSLSTIGNCFIFRREKPEKK